MQKTCFIERVLLVAGAQNTGKSVQLRSMFLDPRLGNNGQIPGAPNLANVYELSPFRRLYLRLTSPHEARESLGRFLSKIEENTDGFHRWNVASAIQIDAAENMPNLIDLVTALDERFSPERIRVVLLHLGTRAAIDQALSRLVKKRSLMRVCHGIYVCPVETRFGLRPPAVEKVIASLSALWGETIVPCGGAAANALGLTTQMPVQSVYLASGPNRKLTLGELTVGLRHAPRWQLAAPYRPAGETVRALSWLGPDKVEAGLDVIGRKLSSEDLEELAALRAIMPTWIAEPASVLVADR